MDSLAVRSHSATAARRALAVAGAVAAAVLVWAVATAAGIDLVVSFGPDGSPLEVTPAAVIAVSLLAALTGWAVLALLEGLSARADTVWRVVAVTVAALSLAGPLSATAPAGTRAALVAMHLAVAAVLVTVLPVGPRSRR
jgi:hypothetical protein